MISNCKIIQDLLPSYIDGLTNEESNRFVENHLNECENCKITYNNMKEELPQQEDTPINVSDGPEKKLIKKIKNKLVLIGATLGVTFSLLGFLVGAYGNVIFQEGNPFPLAKAIIQIELTDAKYVKYASTPDSYISDFNSSSERYSVLKEFMKEKGWTFKEQVGSGLVFEKNKKQVTIGVRQYTGNYFIWSIPEQTTKNK